MHHICGVTKSMPSPHPGGAPEIYFWLPAAMPSSAGTFQLRQGPFRASEFLDFLKQIDAQVPPDLDIHIIMNNYATHKSALVRNWLARRAHYHVHFTPTSASWLNQVERWFADLTRKQLRRGVHTSTSQLEADIRAFIKRHNEDPKPYRWTKSADEIFSSVKRFCQKVEPTLCGEL
jgi:transposase